jgi:predicted hotdog family 3-hydroxylacyl-ACP dehydratase
MMPTLQLGMRYDIATIVAHADGMSLLEELVSYDADRITVALGIRPDTLFCVAGAGVPGWVGIEYMAQAVGAYSGIGDVQAGRAPQIGLLLGSRRYRCNWPTFPLGARLEITAQLIMHDDDQLAVFDCRIESNGQCIATADLKAVRPADVQALVAAQVE